MNNRFECQSKIDGWFHDVSFLKFSCFSIQHYKLMADWSHPLPWVNSNYKINRRFHRRLPLLLRTAITRIWETGECYDWFSDLIWGFGFIDVFCWCLNQEVDEEVNEEESPGAATTAQSEEDLMQKKFQKLRQRNKSSQTHIFFFHSLPHWYQSTTLSVTQIGPVSFVFVCFSSSKFNRIDSTRWIIRWIMPC